MIRTAFLAFAAFALDPSQPDISEAQAKAVAYKAYLCGSIDWQTRNNVRENDEASAARTISHVGARKDYA